MAQNVRDVWLIEVSTHLRSVHRQVHITNDLVADLLHQFLAELRDSDLLKLHLLSIRILQIRELLDMAIEVHQRFHLRLTLVELLQGGIHLCRDITDKLSLQGITVIGQIDLLLLLTGEQDEAHQHEGTQHQRRSQRRSQDTQTDDGSLTGGQRTVLILNRRIEFGDLILQSLDIIGMLHSNSRILPGDIVAI